jgi:hypothetical protein
MLLTLLECSKQAPPPKDESATASNEKATFVNRVWRVAESTGMSPGQLVVFLSEGTLVFASQHGKPALGTWNYDGRSLEMVEEGLPYKADILKLTKTEFWILSHNPCVLPEGVRFSERLKIRSRFLFAKEEYFYIFFPE